MDPRELYFDYVNSGLIKGAGKGGTLPKYYTEKNEALRDEHEKQLKKFVDEEIERILKAPGNGLIDDQTIVDDKDALKDRLQLLVDGAKYREAEKGEQARRALEKLRAYAATNGIDVTGAENVTPLSESDTSSSTPNNKETEPANDPSDANSNDAGSHGVTVAEGTESTSANNSADANSNDTGSQSTTNPPRPSVAEGTASTSANDLSAASSNGTGSQSTTSPPGTSPATTFHQIKSRKLVSDLYDPDNKPAAKCWIDHGYSVASNGQVTILFEEISKRKGGSNYGVEILDESTETWHREIKPESFVKDLLREWRAGANPKNIPVGQSKEKFTKANSGQVTKFHWFACRSLNRADQDTIARNPVTKCCVEFEKTKGPQIILLNDLRGDFLSNVELGKLIESTAARDGIPVPKQWQPKNYIERNRAYHDQAEVSDPLRREPKTWRDVKTDSYAELGITTGEPRTQKAAFPMPGEVGGGKVDHGYIDSVLSERFAAERMRNDTRFERIEKQVDGLNSRVEAYFQEIVSLLKGKSPAAEDKRPTVSISEKLSNQLGSGSLGREQTPAPPYSSPSPSGRVAPSIEV